MAPSILKRGFKYNQNNLLKASMSTSKSDWQKTLGCRHLRKLALRSVLFWIQFWKLLLNYLN